MTSPRRSLQKSISDRKSTCLNSSHMSISYAVFCLKKKIEEMLPLEAQLFGKYGHESYPADTMRRQQRLVLSRFGRSIQVMTARAAGALRGYTAFIRMNHTLYSRDGGFDYAWQGRLPLYFELLFYSPIEFAMRSGIREINYSYGSEQTKASRGCDVARRVGYVKALDPGADGDLRHERRDAAAREHGGSRPNGSGKDAGDNHTQGAEHERNDQVHR